MLVTRPLTSAWFISFVDASLRRENRGQVKASFADQLRYREDAHA